MPDRAKQTLYFLVIIHSELMRVKPNRKSRFEKRSYSGDDTVGAEKIVWNNFSRKPRSGEA